MCNQYKKGLALSGGGFRATLYALGTLWRMNEDGILTELDTITSVSGGSIAAGLLMLKWNELNFVKIDAREGRYRATNFKEIIVDPIIDFCSQTITNKSRIILHTLNPTTSAVKEVCKKYEKLLFGNICLSDVPDNHLAPEFVFYGTNLDTGVSVRISKHEIRDYHIGTAIDHKITLAQAVSISSGFPPVLAPVTLCGKKWKWTDSIYSKLPTDHVAHLREKLNLCDGGLYDNMGLEMIWKHGAHKEYETVFCCDAGAPLTMRWLGGKLKLTMRMTDIMINQQRALRKRMLMRNYEGKEYDGSYWSIASQVKNYINASPLLSESEEYKYKHLNMLGTQLDRFSDNDTRMLINLGFCHADMCMRQHYDSSISKPQLPFNIKSELKKSSDKKITNTLLKT